MTTSETVTNEALSADALPPPQEIVPASGGRGALYRLRTPMSSTALPWVMPYAFVPETEEGVTLFDAGCGTPDATEAMTRQLADLGRTPADVRRLIVSHFHPDHVGMAGWLQEQNPDLELVMHRHDAEVYRDMDRGHASWEQTMREWASVTASTPRTSSRRRRNAASDAPARLRRRQATPTVSTTPRR